MLCKGHDRRVRVLVVEDEWLIADDIATVMSKAGGTVVGPANSVTKALQLITETGCDVAVIDANLGGHSAEPVADALNRRNIPFVVLSGYASEQRASMLADAPFMAKPYREAELIALVRDLIR